MHSLTHRSDEEIHSHREVMKWCTHSHIEVMKRFTHTYMEVIHSHTHRSDEVEQQVTHNWSDEVMHPLTRCEVMNVLRRFHPGYCHALWLQYAWGKKLSHAADDPIVFWMPASPTTGWLCCVSQCRHNIFKFCMVLTFSFWGICDSIHYGFLI